MRVCAYCRVSTDFTDQINSLENQKMFFEGFIERESDFELVKIFVDEGLSGTSTKNRRAFNEMINLALGGEVDLIITKEVSRFARNTLDVLNYTRLLKNKGVGVWFLNDNIDTRQNDGEFRLSIMASVAQEESRKTSERVKWGQKIKMEQGVVFGRSMFGYNVYKGKMYINKEEEKIIKLIYESFTLENMRLVDICNFLNRNNIKPKNSDKWTHSTVRKILTNEKYVGDLCQRKTYTVDYLTHKKKYNKGEVEKIYIENHHQGIIDRELWNKTQEKINKYNRKKKIQGPQK